MNEDALPPCPNESWVCRLGHTHLGNPPMEYKELAQRLAHYIREELKKIDRSLR